MASSTPSGPVGNALVPLSFSFGTVTSATSIILKAIPTGCNYTVHRISVGSGTVTGASNTVTVGNNATANLFLAATTLAAGATTVLDLASASTAPVTATGGTSYIGVAVTGDTSVVNLEVVVWVQFNLPTAARRR